MAFAGLDADTNVDYAYASFNARVTYVNHANAFTCAGEPTDNHDNDRNPERACRGRSLAGW